MSKTIVNIMSLLLPISSIVATVMVWFSLKEQNLFPQSERDLAQKGGRQKSIVFPQGWANVEILVSRIRLLLVFGGVRPLLKAIHQQCAARDQDQQRGHWRQRLASSPLRREMQGSGREQRSLCVFNFPPLEKRKTSGECIIDALVDFFATAAKPS